MNKILNKLNSVPGVVGSMICNDQGHVMAHLFPQGIDTEMLKTVASLLTDNIPVFQECTGGSRTFNFKYEKGRIVVRHDHDRYYVLLCSNTVAVNIQILDMIIDVASKQLDKSVSNEPEKPLTTSAPVQKAPAASTYSPAELIEKGPLSSSLTGIQTSLIKFLGPMAKIIFTECVEKWLETNQPSKEAFPELIEIINQEINDNNKSAQFRQMIAPYI